MKVYVLNFCYYESEEDFGYLVGVFSNKEKIRNYLEKDGGIWCLTMSGVNELLRNNSVDISTASYLLIEETNLDEPIQK